MKNTNCLNKLCELLQWSLSDPFSFSDFYFIDEDMSVIEKRACLNLTVDFLYSSLKAGFLELDTEFSVLQRYGIKNLEELKKCLLSIDDNKLSDISSWEFSSELYQFLWIVIQVRGTKKLQEISDECGLDDYEVFSNNDEKTNDFKQKIFSKLSII